MSPGFFVTTIGRYKAPFFLSIFCCCFATHLKSQKVGIGTSNPQKLLSVNGSIMLDQSNTNDGSLDSAALLFGSAGNAGIFSKRTDGAGSGSLSLATAGQTRIHISSTGNVGIGVQNAIYNFQVNGTAYVSTLRATTLGFFDNHVRIGPGDDANYRLFVSQGNGYIDGNLNVKTSLGIGGINDTYKLYVNGNSRFGGSVYVEDGAIINGTAAFASNVNVTGSETIGSSLNVGNDGIINGNFRVDGRAGIGGATNANYKLIVNGGNSYFEGNTTNSGNATINGTVNAVGNLVIKGNGHVRSNGSSNLRVGFDQVSYDLVVNANSYVDVTANITSFDNGNSDIRVYPCQVTTSINASANAYVLRFQTMGVNATDDTCKVRIINPTGAAIVAIGTLYLMSVAKD
jgi:hypothetical protein